ncbi:hypothetical protein KSC_103500 [Ktedonobacter sp. SOSP1-52]|nr:hypothetical protein KSC_103500 [Ktedonobacter sp. SOSP1-52]
MCEAGEGHWRKNSAGDAEWNGCVGSGEEASGAYWHQDLKECAKKNLKEREEEDRPLFLRSNWGEI